jgi:hypothetical protein
MAAPRYDHQTLSPSYRFSNLEQRSRNLPKSNVAVGIRYLEKFALYFDESTNGSFAGILFLDSPALFRSISSPVRLSVLLRSPKYRRKTGDTGRTIGGQFLATSSRFYAVPEKSGCKANNPHILYLCVLRVMGRAGFEPAKA